MLRRVIPLVRSLPTVIRFPTVRCMSGFGDEEPAWKTDKELAIENRTTMNDMPAPSGAWEVHQKKRNSKFNMLLTLATLFVIGTWTTVVNLDCLYFHDAPVIKSVKSY